MNYTLAIPFAVGHNQAVGCLVHDPQLTAEGAIVIHSEFHDAYEDRERIRGAMFATAIGELPLRKPIVVDAQATVEQAVTAMNEHRIGSVLVEKGGKLVGIFTERDVLKRVVFRDDMRRHIVESVMTPNPETLHAEATIAFALNKMSVGGYRRIPIVDGDGRAVGVLSVRDIVDFLVELFPEEVLNLPPSPSLGIAQSADGG